MSRDSFYTPKILADKLVSFSNEHSFETVADFCVGDGDLLRAAVCKWPLIKCFGYDISKDALKDVKKQHAQWSLAQLDFLDETARIKSKTLNKKFDLVLLNPPFSCIGGTVHYVEFENEKFSASTAMCFLVNSLKYLKSDGKLYAILPRSIAYSQKDHKLWCMLEKKYNLCILEEPGVKYFKDCTPNVILVSLNDHSQIQGQRGFDRISLDFQNMEVFRGKLSMNTVSQHKGKDRLVHSTNMINHKLRNLNQKVNKELSKVTGPALLIPRVGKPIASKICIINESDTYVLSDCVIAIKMKDVVEVKRLFNYLIDNWHDVEQMYNGTGARYITVEKLRKFLNLDITSEIMFDSRKAI
jgi:tRNA1(Val) A37 N6-methylase TrmN6